MPARASNPRVASRIECAIMANRVFEHVRWHPTPADLRGFCAGHARRLSVIGAIAPGVRRRHFRRVDAVDRARHAVAAFIPGLGRAAYLLVHVPTSAIGFVVSPIVVTLVFLLAVVVPVALLRLARR